MTAPSARRLHPGAWWLWALGLAVAATRTSDVLLLALIAGVLGLVVAARARAGGERAFRFYLVLALVIVAIRVVVRIVFGGGAGGAVLVSLPEVPVPAWAAGLRIGGSVTTAELRSAFSDGVRLAIVLLCIGAANALADPRRLLKALPRALADLGTAVVVAVTLAPQIVSSGARVRRAQRLRHSPRSRRRAVRRVVMPVVSDALLRSVHLGVAMEVRGFGRVTGAAPPAAYGLMAGGVTAFGVGVYGILDGSAPPVVGWPAFLAGVVSMATGIWFAGRSRSVTVYRKDPWAASEWLVAGCGAGVAITIVAISMIDPVALHPTGWPAPPVVALPSVLIAAIPAWGTPHVPEAQVKRVRPQDVAA